MTAHSRPPNNTVPQAPVENLTPPRAARSAVARLGKLSATTRSRTTWTPSLILRRILERARGGQSLNADIAKREALNLYTAAQRYFGSWEQAVGTAEQTAGSVRMKFTRESVLARIREQAAEGLPIKTTHPLLYAYRHPAKRFFGSWAAAVAAAGVLPVADDPSTASPGEEDAREHP